MGTTLVAGGAITFTSPSARWRRSIASPCTSGALVLGFTPARLQISSAIAGLTREKSFTRTCFTDLPGESWSIARSIPSSTPCGCGLISCGSRGSSSLTRG